MQQPDDYALVIGVGQYPNYRPLQGALKDAQEFDAWLRDKDSGGGLLEENCNLLLNPSSPAGAEIDVALDLILTRVDLARAQGREPRRFYFYFSGHGHANRVDEINLCLNSWSSKRFSRVALSANECWGTVVQCIGFSEVIVFLDCCRVRVVGAGGVPPGFNCAVPLAAAGETLTFKGFSSEFLNPSYETIFGSTDGHGDEIPIVHGYFTAALLAALKGGAASVGGGVRPSQLKEYLEREVIRLALNDRKKQQARSIYDLKDSSLFGTASFTGEGHIVVKVSTGRIGPLVLVFPDGNEITCPDVSQDWILLLKAGTHLLIDRGLNPPEEKPIHFKPVAEMEITYVDF